MANQFKPNMTVLRSELRQATQSYQACLSAMQNGDHKNAVTLQLSAIESLNQFNEQLLKDLEQMRKGKPRRTWAP